MTNRDRLAEMKRVTAPFQDPIDHEVRLDDLCCWAVAEIERLRAPVKRLTKYKQMYKDLCG